MSYERLGCPAPCHSSLASFPLSCSLETHTSHTQTDTACSEFVCPCQ